MDETDTENKKYDEIAKKKLYGQPHRIFAMMKHRIRVKRLLFYLFSSFIFIVFFFFQQQYQDIQCN